MKSCTGPPPGHDSSLCQVYPRRCSPLLSHLVASHLCYQIKCRSSCVEVILILLKNDPKAQGSDAGSLGMPKRTKRSHEVLSLSEKVKVLQLMKESTFTSLLLQYCYNVSLLFVLVNLLLCLTYKLNLIIGMYVCTGKTQSLQGLVLSTVSPWEHVPCR